MAYWLFKSEPNTWSWEDQVKEGAKGAEWDGVRNYQARNNMQAMKKGELGFFYHSVNEKRVVGIVKVVKEAHPDSTTDDERWHCVDVAAVEPLPAPVTLDQIKGEPKLEEMVLVKNSRLSVQPVTAAEWKVVCKMGGLKKPPTA
ncbi:MAG: EVE domain-containing protein [Hyphomicrobiales bacterium]|nr:EVE domain-containing protein [Hyphomicrobiales bacterium]